MNFKKIVLRLTKMLLLIAFMAWLIPNPWIFSVELGKYNPDKAAACERLKTKMTRPEGVRFFVSYSPAVLLVGASALRKSVFFGPFYINREDFMIIAAHELGHIEYKTNNQVLADFFAMKFVGTERLMDSRKKSGSPPDYLNTVATCYESNGKDCPDVADSSIIYTFRQFLDGF